MAFNVFKPRGATKGSLPTAGGAVISQTPLFGIVKDNIDPTRSGRLQVYISELGGLDPDKADSWVHVNYMSPFYGLTPATGPESGPGSFDKNPHSYGMWYSPPDIGTTVICIFINGDPNYGFWIGCVPQPEALYMVPAIAGYKKVILNEGEANSYGGAKLLPVVNINPNDKKTADSTQFLDLEKPVHSSVAQTLMRQGLIRDTIRGVISSSAQRETPSRVGWGVSTPGRPIFNGGATDQTASETANSGEASKMQLNGRRGGHSIVMDDGDIDGVNQLLRLRTSLGHQILMSDDGQCLFIIHSNGQSWIELGKEGTIDMYSTNSVNIRTQGDLNLHADNNININAKKNFTLSAENIKLNSDYKTDILVGSDFAQQTKGKHKLKVNGGMSMHSDGEASYLSKNITYINGSKINLNTGQASLVPENVDPPELIAHTDTLFDAQKGWIAAPGKLLSITSRAPAHAPWAMANQGVDVKVDNDAASNFPPAPTEAQAATNAATPAAPSNPVSAATVSSIPPVNAVSKAIDQNTTAAMVGQVATLAANSPASSVVNTARGTGVVQTPNGAQGVVGKFAFNPNTMEQSGVIKPGAGALASSLIAAGKTVEEALTPNLFTGVPGAENLKAFAQNTTAQINAQIVNFQKAQTALTQAGAICGKESAATIAGIVTAGAVNGVEQAVNLIKGQGSVGSLISSPTGPITPAINNLLGTPDQVAGAGKFAANMASTVTSGLSSIASSITSMATGAGGALQNLYESAKGVAGSAFNAIVKSLPKLQANVPQNLDQIASQAQAATNQAAGAVGNLANNIPGQVQNVVGGFGQNINAITSDVISVIGEASTSIQNSASAISSGLNNIPGGERAVAAIVNTNLPSNLSGILPPGNANITAAIDQSISNITTGLPANALNDLKNSLTQSGETLKSLATTGLPAGAAAQLNSAISSLSSGGSIPIKLPTVGEGTLNTASLDSLAKSVLGDAKIPAPIYSGNPFTIKPGSAAASTQSQKNLEEQTKLLEEINTLNDKRYDIERELRNALFALQEAKTQLPAGDPKIQQAQENVNAKRKELLELDDQIKTLREQVYQLAQ